MNIFITSGLEGMNNL